MKATVQELPGYSATRPPTQPPPPPSTLLNSLLPLPSSPQASPPLGPRVHYPHLLRAFATSGILSPESPFFPFLSIGFFGLTFKPISTAALDSRLHISAPPVHSPHHSQSLPKVQAPSSCPLTLGVKIQHRSP